MNLLDEIIDSHDSGARIVSEEHDTGKISTGPVDFEGEFRRIAGVWDASEMGISLEEVQARIAAADTPEAREKILADLKQRSLRRAGLDNSTGKVSMMSAGRLPWHGLGVVVDKAATSAEAIRFAGLDWAVSKIALSWEWNGQKHVADDSFAIVREDTGAKLGTVGGRYAPIQSKDGFSFLDDVMKEYGAKYETAGAIYGGKRVWILAHMPGQAFAVNGVDSVEPYVLFSNCHDGSGAAWAYPTSVRVECANTLRLSGGDKSKGLYIRHTGSVKSKVDAARQTLGLASKQFEDFKGAAEDMARKKVDVRHYAHDVLDAVLEVTQADALKGADVLAAAIAKTEANRELERKSFEKKIQRRGEVLNEILERYESERNGTGGMRGTVWAAFNAVTDFADHAGLQKRYSGTTETRASRHFESVLDGQDDNLKQVAYQKALAL